MLSALRSRMGLVLPRTDLIDPIII